MSLDTHLGEQLKLENSCLPFENQHINHPTCTYAAQYPLKYDCAGWLLGLYFIILSL